MWDNGLVKPYFILREKRTHVENSTNCFMLVIIYLHAISIKTVFPKTKYMVPFISFDLVIIVGQSSVVAESSLYAKPYTCLLGSYKKKKIEIMTFALQEI